MNSNNNKNNYVIPGDILGDSNNYNNGIGCYLSYNKKNIISSLLGEVIIDNTTNTNPLSSSSSSSTTTTPNNNNITINQNKERLNVISSSYIQSKDVVIDIGDIVLVRVLKLNINQVIVEILSVSDRILRIKSRGVIRREDIRLNDIDSLVIHECFRPGDIVRAIVISLGDARQYFLSTAEAEFGVKWAKSEKSGQFLVPINWKVSLQLYFLYYSIFLFI